MRGVVFEANGKTYSINGTAKSRKKQFGYYDVEDIWADDTAKINELVKAGIPSEHTQLKIYIGSIIDDGLNLCTKK